MPQLDLSTFPTQLFWLTVSFGVLYVLVARFFAPRIQDVLDARQQRLDMDLSQAARLKDEAENIRTMYEKALADARMKSQNLVQDAIAAMKQRATAEHARLDGDMAQRLQTADTAIAAARSKAMADAEPVVRALTAGVVEKILSSPASEAEVQSAIAHALRGRPVHN